MAVSGLPMLADQPSITQLRWYAAWLEFVGDPAGAAAVGAVAATHYSDAASAIAAVRGLPRLAGPGWRELVGSGGHQCEDWQALRQHAHTARALLASYRITPTVETTLSVSEFDQLMTDINSGVPERATAAAAELRRRWRTVLSTNWAAYSRPELTADDNSAVFNGGTLRARGLLAIPGRAWINSGREPGDAGWIPDGYSMPQGTAFAMAYRRTDPGDRRRALLCAAIAAVPSVISNLADPGSKWLEPAAYLQAVETALNAAPSPAFDAILSPLYAVQQSTPHDTAVLRLEAALGYEPHSLALSPAQLDALRTTTARLRSILGTPVEDTTVLQFIIRRWGQHVLSSSWKGWSSVVHVQLGGPAEPTDMEWLAVSDIVPGQVFARIGGTDIKFPKLPLNGFVFTPGPDYQIGPDRTAGAGLLCQLMIGRWPAGDFDGRLAAEIAAEMWKLHSHGVLQITDAVRNPQAARAAADPHTLALATTAETARGGDTDWATTAVLLGRDPPARSSGGIVLNSDSGMGSLRWEGGVGRVATPVFVDHRMQSIRGWVGSTAHGELFRNSKVNRQVLLERYHDLADRYEQHHIKFATPVVPDHEFINGPDWVRAHFDTWMQLRYDAAIGELDIADRGAEALGKSLDAADLHARILRDGLVRTGLDPLRLYRAARIAGAGDIAAYAGMAEPKVPQVFDLNHEIAADHIRFRVLPDGDMQHFTVGAETNCCQIVGGAGEDAAVQSYVNSHAGVLVLEAKFGGEWTLIAQSYFHWVPGDQQQYILDNVEHNAAAVQHMEKLYKTNLRSLYAILATEIRGKLPHVAHFVAGSDFSKIGEHDSWGTHSQDRDPRRYLHLDADEDEDEDADGADAAVGTSDHDEFPGYSDYDPQSGLDLTNPKFAVKQPEVPKP